MHHVFRVVFLAAVRAKVLEVTRDGGVHQKGPFSLFPAVGARMNKSAHATRIRGLLGSGLVCRAHGIIRRVRGLGRSVSSRG